MLAVAELAGGVAVVVGLSQQLAAIGLILIVLGDSREGLRLENRLLLKMAPAGRTTSC